MKLYQLIQAFEFDEVFPEVNNMFPNANLHRDVYEKAFSMLQELKPTLSKKTIRYELMDDPNTNGMYVGADDNSFYTTWDVIIGKEIKKGKGVFRTQTVREAPLFISGAKGENYEDNDNGTGLLRM
jgi:hypothetical protein